MNHRVLPARQQQLLLAVCSLELKMNKPSGLELAYRLLIVLGLFAFSMGNAETVILARARMSGSFVRYVSPGGQTSGACDS